MHFTQGASVISLVPQTHTPIHPHAVPTPWPGPKLQATSMSSPQLIDQTRVSSTNPNKINTHACAPPTMHVSTDGRQALRLHSKRLHPRVHQPLMPSTCMQPPQPPTVTHKWATARASTPSNPLPLRNTSPPPGMQAAHAQSTALVSFSASVCSSCLCKGLLCVQARAPCHARVSHLPCPGHAHYARCTA